MWPYVLKIGLSAVVLVAVAEIARRSTFWAAGIFWLVLPSLLLFVLFPWLLRQGVNFWASLGCSVVTTTLAYVAMVALLGRLGVRV